MRPAGSRHIALVGLSGTGKSTVGALISRRFQLRFVDVDRVVEDRCGMTIADLFALSGEAAFRDLEERALVDSLAGPPAVIATGAGIVVRPTNRAELADAAFVVWLQAPAEMLADRLEGTTESRPLLDAGTVPGTERSDRATKLRRLGHERETLYRDVAHLVVDATASPEETAQRLSDQLTSRSIVVGAGDAGSSHEPRDPEQST